MQNAKVFLIKLKANLSREFILNESIFIQIYLYLEKLQKYFCNFFSLIRYTFKVLEQKVSFLF